MRAEFHTLFVCCHATPNTRGGILLKSLTSEWARHRSSYEMTDLAELKFNPIAGRSDFLNVSIGDFNFRQEQVRASATSGFADDIATEHKKLARATHVVLCFPLWVFGMPATMKGWIERVFARGYSYGKDMEYQTAGMVGKTACAVITAAGVEEDYMPGGKHEPMENILRCIIDLPLSYMGFSVAGAKVICDVESKTLDEFNGLCSQLSSDLHRELMGGGA